MICVMKNMATLAMIRRVTQGVIPVISNACPRRLLPGLHMRLLVDAKRICNSIDVVVITYDLRRIVNGGVIEAMVSLGGHIVGCHRLRASRQLLRILA